MPDTKSVLYVHSNAFITCDCGQEVVLGQKFYGSPKFTGDCQNCQVEIQLQGGKFKILNPSL